MPVKYVPEPGEPWRVAGDLTLDRTAMPGRLCQLDGYAVEQAVRLVDGGLDAEILAVTMGPPAALDGLRTALAMGAHRAVHITDERLHGSDALATSLVLAAAIRRLGFDLVLCGMASTDAATSVVPSMLAERLGVAEIAHASALHLADGTVTAQRYAGGGTERLVAALPAVVSVTDRSGEPRRPSPTAAIEGRRKPVDTWSLAELPVPPEQVGLAHAAVVVDELAAQPPRTTGRIVVDSRDGAAELADYLVSARLI